MQLLSYIVITVFDSVLLDEEHVCVMSEAAAAMLTCIQYPRFCRQTLETTGLTLQGLLHCHCAATQRCVYVCIIGGGRVDTTGHKSPPLIIRPCCLLPLRAPGSWLHSFVAKPNLRDSLGIASGYRKQGHGKKQMTTQLYTWHIVGWTVKTTQTFFKQKCDLH